MQPSRPTRFSTQPFRRYPTRSHNRTNQPLQKIGIRGRSADDQSASPAPSARAAFVDLFTKV
jgi:hypothetical protein